jgi:uncharacterized membrane protein
MKQEKKSKDKDTQRIVVVALSALGIAVSLYLTYLYHTKGTALFFCTAGSGCDTVRESPYSVISGVPVPLLGVIGYSLIFLLSFTSSKNQTRWPLLYMVSLIGFVFSAYLTYIELFILNAVCVYCLISSFAITAIFITILIGRPVLPPRLSPAKLLTISVIIAGVVLLGSIYLQSNRLSTESDSFQMGLAKHLGGIGATMYGSFQCPHCLTQKLLFGKEAFKYVRYVECDPMGENANTALCYEKGIHSYPTWEINGRFYIGTRSLQELARISGYKPGSTAK